MAVVNLKKVDVAERRSEAEQQEVAAVPAKHPIQGMGSVDVKKDSTVPG